jgi:hypothetical protein
MAFFIWEKEGNKYRNIRSRTNKGYREAKYGS